MTSTNTLKNAALKLENNEIERSEAEEIVANVFKSTGFTRTEYSPEDPNRMVYRGNPENSLFTLDMLDANRKIEKTTWRIMREIIVNLQSSSSEPK